MKVVGIERTGPTDENQTRFARSGRVTAWTPGITTLPSHPPSSAAGTGRLSARAACLSARNPATRHIRDDCRDRSRPHPPRTFRHAVTRTPRRAPLADTAQVAPRCRGSRFLVEAGTGRQLRLRSTGRDDHRFGCTSAAAARPK